MLQLQMKLPSFLSHTMLLTDRLSQSNLKSTISPKRLFLKGLKESLKANQHRNHQLQNQPSSKKPSKHSEMTMRIVKMMRKSQKENLLTKDSIGAPSTSANFAKRDSSSALLQVATTAKLIQVKVRPTFIRSKSVRTERLREIFIVKPWITTLKITTREVRQVS